VLNGNFAVVCGPAQH